MKLKSYLQCRRQILMFYSFLQFKLFRAAMQIITSLELLGTLIAGLEQKKANKIDFTQGQHS